MQKNDYILSENGDTTILDYNRKKPFSSFFPGVAGRYGMPMWVFYVNRGQCIASFGIENKDKSMLEFFPANRAYQLTSKVGFRTFLKVTSSAGGTAFYEPFRQSLENTVSGCTNSMKFSPSCLEIEETNPKLSLKIKVTYMTVPNQHFPALARRVEVTNLSEKELSIEMVDGLPWVTAYGTNSWVQKHMCRTGEAWVQVENIENRMPVFKLKVDTADKPEVEFITSGHFSLYFDEAGLLDAIVDPEAVFGSNTSLEYPAAFFESKGFRIPSFQTYENFTPCAMGYRSFSLSQGETRAISGVFGYAGELKALKGIQDTVMEKGWFEKKLSENKEILSGIGDYLATFSGSLVYDNYCRHTFIDNVLRGGFPVTLASDGDKKVTFHVYSRKHGDLERDYNNFSLQPAYYSQGNGNFRDINQNRRNDLWFNPDVGDSNIRTFFNLLQLDGHNPLVLKGSQFVADPKKINEALKGSMDGQDAEKLKAFLKKPYTPGLLLTEVERLGIPLKSGKDEFIGSVLKASIKKDDSEHGEGYWSDHWTYNLDHVLSFLSLFPEKKEELLFKDKTYTYYQNFVWVNPRKVRYILRNGKPFQTNNVEEDHHKLKSKPPLENSVRVKNGAGEVYHTTLFSKMFCLAANKVATLDPFGIGIELEGGKSNWNDALNGLPGLFGSSLNETLELKRLVAFMLEASKGKGFDGLDIPSELAKFAKGLLTLIKDKALPAFDFWDQSAALKEQFRKSVKLGLKGDEKKLTRKQVQDFLALCLIKLNQGIEKVPLDNGVIHSYFINEVIEYDLAEENGRKYVIPKKFLQKPLALFLEGPVHQLKIAPKEEASKIHRAVKSSTLYDTKLKMYKLNESLKKVPMETGRVTVFTPGWLENESIFLHMEYKFLLEILRSGLYFDFFQDFKDALIPFQTPEVYGRSVLENSSFIVTSANSNASLHGTGFVARLSGSTAEFIHMWLLMNLGSNPFFMNGEGRLALKFAPILPSWMFSKESRNVSWKIAGEKVEARLPENHYAFLLFGKTLVVYHNPPLKDTFGDKAAKVKKIHLTGFGSGTEMIEGNVLPMEFSLRMREGKYKMALIEME